MGYPKKIRLEYYEVVCRKISDKSSLPDRAFDLSLWLEKAGNMPLSERMYDFHEEKARLDKCSFDKDSGIWCLSFLRLRETNIPSIAKEETEARPIPLEEDEFIGEEACALYDSKTRILTLQRNIHSLGPTGVESYLNSIWSGSEEMIYLRPICPVDILDRIDTATEFRNISIRFADIPKSKGSWSKKDTPLKKVYDSIGVYEGINARIEITMGYERDKALNSETVKDTISEILDNRDAFSKAQIGFKEGNAPVEVLDLFEKKLHDFLSIDLEKRASIDYDVLIDRMIEIYTKSKERILQSMRKRN